MFPQFIFRFFSPLILYLVIPDFSLCSQLPSKLPFFLLTGWSKYVTLTPWFSALYFSMCWLSIAYRVSPRCFTAEQSPLGPSPCLTLYFIHSSHTKVVVPQIMYFWALCLASSYFRSLKTIPSPRFLLGWLKSDSARSYFSSVCSLQPGSASTLPLNGNY